MIVDDNSEQTVVFITNTRIFVDAKYWRINGDKTLQSALRHQVNQGLAKNVILFIGDGMSASTVTSARILKGQRNNRPGEESKLVFEEFPNIALSKVS